MSCSVDRYVNNPEVLSDDEIEFQRLKVLFIRKVSAYTDCYNAALEIISDNSKFLDRVASEVEEIARRLK